MKKIFSALIILGMIIAIIGLAGNSDAYKWSIRHKSNQNTISSSIPTSTTPTNNTTQSSNVLYISPTNNTIQGAINQIKDGGTIYLAPGTYKAYNINIGKSITIIGQNAIIDAQKKGNIFTVPSTRKLTLQGITLTNGYLPSGSGGAIHATGGKVIVNNCKFTYNQAYWGAGICAEPGSQITTTGCIYDHGTAYWGGGGIYTYSARITATGNTFTNNIATDPRSSPDYGGCGGAIGMTYPTSGTDQVSGNTFINNQACNGAAVFYASGSAGTVNILNNDFRENKAFQFGGAIDVDNGVGYSSNEPAGPTGIIKNNQFTNNIAGTEVNGGGGAICNYYSKITVDTNTFTGNTAPKGSGGAIYTTGYPTNTNTGSSIVNCVFNQNKADSGGAIYNSGIASVLNCIFNGNSGLYGIICNLNSKLTQSGNTFNGNTGKNIYSG